MGRHRCVDVDVDIGVSISACRYRNYQSHGNASPASCTVCAVGGVRRVEWAVVRLEPNLLRQLGGTMARQLGSSAARPRLKRRLGVHIGVSTSVCRHECVDIGVSTSMSISVCRYRRVDIGKNKRKATQALHPVVFSHWATPGLQRETL